MRTYRLTGFFPSNKSDMNHGILPTLYYISHELVNLGVEENVICLGNNLIRKYYEGINLHFVRQPYLINSIRKIHKLWKIIPPDIVHGHGSDALPYALLKSANIKNVPLITHFHEVGKKVAGITVPPVRDLKGFLKMSLWYYVRLPLREKFISSVSDKIIAVSRKVANDIAREYNVPKQKIEVVYNGVDTNLFFPKNKDRAKKLLKIQNKKLLLYVGALTFRKGINYLIEAYRILLKRYKGEMILLLIGGIPKWYGSEIYKTYLDKWSKDLVGKIIFKDAVPHYELPLYYNAADITILPSIEEPFGKVVLESLACCTPVVVSQNAGVAEILRHKETGFLVDPKDKYSLADSLYELLENVSLREKMGKKGYAFVTENYNWRRISERILKIYRNI